VYRAVLDTCALVPGHQRDFLLQLAAEEAYAPLRGSGILAELDYVLARLDAKRGREDSEASRKRLFEQMKRAFPGAEINAPKDREYEYGLSDPDDGHVAHAALLGKADAIVTDELAPVSRPRQLSSTQASRTSTRTSSQPTPSPLMHKRVLTHSSRCHSA